MPTTCRPDPAPDPVMASVEGLRRSELEVWTLRHISCYLWGPISLRCPRPRTLRSRPGQLSPFSAPLRARGCSSASLSSVDLSRLSRGDGPAPSRPACRLQLRVLLCQQTFIRHVLFARDLGGGAQVADSSILLNGSVEVKHPPVGEKFRPRGVE